MTTTSTTEPIAVYRPTFGSLFHSSPVAAVIGVVGLVFAVLLAANDALKPPLGKGFYYFWGACGMMLVWALWLWIKFLYRTKRVELFEDEMVWKDAQGEHGVRWDEVAEVYAFEVVQYTFGIKEISEAELKVVLRDGARVVFNHSLFPFDKMAAHVQSLSARALLDEKRKEFDRGEVRFGPLALRPAGIDFEGELLPWDELQHYAVWNGAVYFVTTKHQGDNCKGIGLRVIPNYVVMFKMMEDLGHLPSKPEECVPSARG